MTTIKCNECNEYKQVNELVKDTSKKIGYRKICKLCHNLKIHKKRLSVCHVCGKSGQFSSKNICGICNAKTKRNNIKKKCCTSCKTVQPISNFYIRSKSKVLYKSICKNCCTKSTINNKKKCVVCLKQCWSKNKTPICNKCKNNKSYENYLTLTLGDKTYDKHKYAKYSYIRFYARKKAEELGWNKCCKCGYDKHYEVAHIKDINTYPPETLIHVINDESNLMPLCPNCHWEFDNGKK